MKSGRAEEERKKSGAHEQRMSVLCVQRNSMAPEVLPKRLTAHRGREDAVAGESHCPQLVHLLRRPREDHASFCEQAD